jgi:exopolysaccharide production protein ExoQ
MPGDLNPAEMIYRLVILFSLGCFRWLVKRDNAMRDGISRALWIPTLWVMIISSRPLSMWAGFGGGTSTMEGSPLDALFFFTLIIAALVVLSRRGLNWPLLISQNWPVFLFYFYLLFSVLWANSPPVSFKRWFKEFGNIAVLLVILTEQNPQQALRAVFVRCAYLMLPLSLVFIRYFPSMGRYYSSHGGEGEFTGVAMQKNSLGALVLICGLIVLWDWLELRREQKNSPKMRKHTYLHWGLLLIGVYLFYMCNSATSMVCFGIGVLIIAATRLPLLRKRLQMLGVVAILAVCSLWLLNQISGIDENIVEGLGRNMTFTGRTDVWRELLNLNTDPVFGVGFMSFWDDMQYRAKLPYWVAFSAHNGYLEEYLAGGWAGIFFLVLMLLGIGYRINSRLMWDGDFGVIRFAIFAITLVANFSESNFACMTPIGFLFLLAAIGYAPGFVPQGNPKTVPFKNSDSGDGPQYGIDPIPAFQSHDQ